MEFCKEDETKPPAIVFPYQLDKFQQEGIEAIEKEENILITAHTGAGKSTFAEYATACAVRDNKKIIYTSPIKTLSNQKFSDFKRNSQKYGLQENDIGIMTGDHKINPDAQCCVMTTEILRNMLYKNTEYFEDVKYVVFDEVHYFNDKERGHVWEECIIMLPLHIILIKLSATIDKAQEFSNWVEKIRDRKTNLISTPFRPVPLKHYVLVPFSESLVCYSEKDNHFDTKNYSSAIDNFKLLMKKKKYLNHKSIFNPLVEFLKEKNLLPAIYFVFSRKKCQDFAETITVSLVDHLERKEIENIFDFYIRKLITTNENIEQIENVKKLAMKGIGFHHSGMIPALKEIIEVLFGHKDKEGNPQPLIKVLFATETFAVGVNMPAKTTVFSDLNKFDNYSGIRNLYSHEYTQMAGRAGRRGLDKLGNVIYYPIRDIEPLYCIKNMVINKPETLTSKFLINIKFIMKGIKSKEQEITKILEKSLMNNENNKRKIFLENQIIELKEKQEINEKHIQIYDKEHINIVEKFLKIQNTFDSLSGKQRKKIMKEYNKCKQEYEYCKQSKNIHNLIINANELVTQIKENISNINYIQNSNIEEMNKILNFLKKYYYIDNNSEINITNISHEHITLKGIITSEFNEANELLMTEMIQQGIFKDIEKNELLSILSIFCDDFDKENEYYINDLLVSDKCKDRLNKIKKIHNDLLTSTSEFHIQYEPEISLQFTDIVWLWCNNKSFGEIIKEYAIFEGNFIKNMQKIHNIVQELNIVAEILEDHELLKKIQNIESLIIKDIVDAKSLYLI
jgi:superfamily II RNA helicase